MDFLDEILAELGPEEKEQLLASAVAGLSPINEATAPGPVITTQGEIPLFPVDRFKMAPMQLPQVEFDPQNLMQTMNLSQVDRPRIQPDLTPVTVGGSVDELPVVFTPDVQAAELLAKVPRQKPIAGEKEFDALLAEQEAEAEQAVVQLSNLIEQATAPASTKTTEPLADPVAVEAADKVAQEALAPAKEMSTEPLAAQVGASPVMQPRFESTYEQTRERTRGVDRTNDQYQRRLQLSRLLELQALRQLQKAEQTKARPQSLMDLYRGNFAARAAQDAQRRINMAREYFNRSGAIQRELVKEKDIERKRQQAKARADQQAAGLAERQRRAMEDEAIRKRGLDLKEEQLNWKKLSYDKMTPYEKAVVAVRRREVTGKERDRANNMARRSRETWQTQVKNIQTKLSLLSSDRRTLNNRRFSGRFMMPREAQALEDEISIIDRQIEVLEEQQQTFNDALNMQIEAGTNISTDGQRKPKNKSRKPLDQIENTATR